MNIPFIETDSFGKIAFGLKVDNNEDIQWFSFNKEKDAALAKSVLKKNKNRFKLRVITSPPEKAPMKLIVYLGGMIDVSLWKEDFTINFEKEKYPDECIWTATDKDKDKIHRFWNAGRAKIALFVDVGVPIRHNNCPLETIIETEYDDWFYDIHRNIKKDIQLSQAANITGRFYQQIIYAKDKSNSVIAVEQYYRIKGILARLFKKIKEIQTSPYYSYEKKILAIDTLNPVCKTKAFYSIIKSIGYIEHQNKKIPKKLLMFSTYKNFINRENAYIYLCLKEIESILVKILKELRKYILQNENTLKQFNGIGGIIVKNYISNIESHKDIVIELEQTFRRIKSLQRFFKFVEKSKHYQQKISIDSEILYYDNRYLAIKKLMSSMTNLINYIDTSENSMPFEVAPFHEQYQRWCFLKLLQCFTEIGFKSNDSLKKVAFYNNPIPQSKCISLYHDSCPGYWIDIYYEKKYPRYSKIYQNSKYGWMNQKDDKNKTDYTGIKHTPDIALEIFHYKQTTIPFSIVTLDPTLGTKPDATKYEYESAIRSFVSVNEDGYFEKLVKATWGISPGSKKNKEQQYINERFSFSQGYIILNPNKQSIENLKMTIRKILSKNTPFDV